MKAARVILMVIMAVMAAIEIFAFDELRYSPDFLLKMLLANFLLAPLFLSALTVLISSWVNFEYRNGKFVIDKNSRVADWFLGDKEKKITICSLFWRTVFGIFLLIVFLFAASLAISFLVLGATAARFEVLGFIAFLSLLFYLIAMADKKKAWAKGTLLICPVLVAVGLFVVWPIVRIMASEHISIFGALPIYFVLAIQTVGATLLCMLVLAAGVAVSVGLVWLVYRLVKPLKDSTIGKILADGWHFVKARTCPIVSVVDFR